MSWFRICDTLPFHRKILKAGNEAVGAWARMGSWCAKHLSNGAVSLEAAELITTPAVLDRLVVVGLLERSEDGFVLHDYLEYNATADEVEAERSKKREVKVDSGRRGGIASGIARRKHGKQTEAQRIEAPSHPIPYPSQKETDPDLFGEGPSGGGAHAGPLTSRAAELLHELNVARMTSIEGARRIAPTARTLQHIVARLSEGATDEDVRHVIAVCTQEVRVNPASEKWFNHETPFRPDNFNRKLSMTVRGAAVPPGPPAPPKPHRDRRPADVEREEQAHRERMRRERERELAGGNG